MNRKNLILTVLIVITAGALLSREYPQMGKITLLTAMAAYLLVDIVRIFKYAWKFKKTNAPQKARIAMWLTLLFITIGAIMGRSVSYFLMLVILGLDYLLTTRAER